jgi:hypothetical protein
MITAIVQFSLPKPLSLEEAARAFDSTAPKYQGVQGLSANTICAAKMAAALAESICGPRVPPPNPSTTLNGGRA